MKQRIFYVFLGLVLVLGLTMGSTDAAAENSCGDHAFWHFDDASGTLTVTGTGPMYAFAAAPWGEISEQIQCVVLEDGITAVGSSAFRGCSNLRQVSLPESVTTIGYAAFHSCSKLEEICLPASVSLIEDFAFASCTGLKSVSVPGGVTNLGEGVFYRCTGLEGVSLPESLVSLGDMVFYECCSLESLVIPTSVSRVGFCAFGSCGTLKTIAFLGNAPMIHDYAFSGVTANAYYPLANATWTAEKLKNYGGAIAWGQTGGGEPCGKNAWWRFAEETGILTIGGTGAIDDYSEKALPPWYGIRSKILKAVVEEGITHLGSHAFLDCGRLTQVELPTGLLTVGDYAFADCTSLKTVHIPDTVTAIDHHAFYYCFALDGVHLPDSVASLGDGAFENCSGMTEITLSGNLTNLGDFLFFRCSGLKSITIPQKVTAIGSHIFYACSGLKSITFPENLASIGKYAFTYCSELEDVRFLGNAPVIGNNAFEGVAAFVHYPGNRTWTEAVRGNYGGTLTWNPCDPVTGGEIICKDGIYYYYIGSDLQYAAGLVCVNGDYYYIRSGGYAAIGAYWCTNTNGITQEGFYIFGSDGKMILTDQSKTGIYLEDGKYYYYVDGEIQFAAGLVFVDGAYYYIRSGGFAAIGSYWVTNTNGITAEGFYIFGNDGKMILTDTSKTGIYLEDGKYYYYVDGEIAFGAGLVYVDGAYYYIRSGGYAAIGEYYVSNTNGLMPEGIYTFGYNGKMIR